MLFKVENMSCQHCVNAVTRAIRTLDANAQVQIDLALGQVRVDCTTEPAAVIALLAEEDYPAQLLEA